MSPIRCILLALVLAAPAGAAAQTVNYEQATTALAASCGTDIDNVCRGVNLDPTRLKECLRKNDDNLTPKCKADFLRIFAAIEQRVSARDNLAKLCNWELNRFCKDIRADPVKGLQCLLDSAKKGTPNCNKAIDATGYR